jgi:hypothetical protein
MPTKKTYLQKAVTQHMTNTNPAQQNPKDRQQR